MISSKNQVRIPLLVAPPPIHSKIQKNDTPFIHPQLFTTVTEHPSFLFLYMTGAARHLQGSTGVMMLMLTACTAVPTSPIAVAFTPAGLLFPYYVGVGYELRRLGMITPTTPLGGSSAGSIVAAALACGVSEGDVTAGLAALVDDVRAGTRLNVALRRQLSVLLPVEAASSAEAHALSIGYLEVLPRPGRRIVSSWTSRDDLIDVICASCNWPLFFSKWPLVFCRRSLALDGFFSVPRDRFGCPPLPAERTLAVTALPKVDLSAFGEAAIIRPDGWSDDETGLQMPVSASTWCASVSHPLPPAAGSGVPRAMCHTLK